MTLLGSPERRLVTLCGLVAFLSGIVFSMVGALAPMFSRDLHIPTQSIGIIMASYMLASAVSGFPGHALSRPVRPAQRRWRWRSPASSSDWRMTGLAPNLPLLIGARIVSGVFAGPSNALSIAIVVDNIPAERRGGALGTVAAFGAMAQIIGLPAGPDHSPGLRELARPILRLRPGGGAARAAGHRQSCRPSAGTCLGLPASR